MKENSDDVTVGVRLAGKLEVHRSNLQLAWSSDGRKLAAPYDNDTARIWPWPSGIAYGRRMVRGFFSLCVGYFRRLGSDLDWTARPASAAISTPHSRGIRD